MGRRVLNVREKLKLWFLTMFYHSCFSYEYVVDTIMEPVFWFVDHFTHLLGPAFVVAVVLLVSIVVLIAHFVGLPFWLKKSTKFTGFLVILGYWILINLAFNFYQTATVSPGIPDNQELLSKCSVTVCKKCISPKPSRTHHCSICNRCYLNMDHHCPWVNNCVGHFNRRYFFLTMTFIVVGCVFIMLFGVELAFKEVILDVNPIPDCRNVTEFQWEAFEQLQLSNQFDGWGWNDPDEFPEECNDELALLFLNVSVSRRNLRLLIYFAGLLCIGTSLALGGLSLWHAKLITNGETSIEYHINKAEKKKSMETFANIYDCGRKENWIIFLGLDQPGVNFFRNILFPSSHKPTGDGYDWSHITKRAKSRRPSNINSTNTFKYEK